jgi:hypothetical protein
MDMGLKLKLGKVPLTYLGINFFKQRKSTKFSLCMVLLGLSANQMCSILTIHPIGMLHFELQQFFGTSVKYGLYYI